MCGRPYPLAFFLERLTGYGAAPRERPSGAKLRDRLEQL